MDGIFALGVAIFTPPNVLIPSLNAVPESADRPTVLAIATYFKGGAFLDEAHRQGCRVFLLTRESLKDEPWPAHAIEETFFLPGQGDAWVPQDLLKGAAHLARTRRIDRIVALDDFDLEKAAALREHLRIPGLGESATRFFRDKLAMRTRAREAGVPVPDFVHLLNEDALRDFTARVPAPWIVKPRSQASAVGLRKAPDEAALWRILDELGDEFSFYLVERFVPGDVFHVDSVVVGGEVVFARASRYLAPPFEVMHGGGIFRSANVPLGSDEDGVLQRLNRQVLAAMGLVRGVAHTEFIRSADDGRLVFLETSARVGGAHLAEMVEAASGVNLWREWAKLEALGDAYTPPSPSRSHAGIIVSLARQEWPDTSAYAEDEIAWRMHKRHHAGLIVRADDPARVTALLDDYAERFYRDFHASAPPPDRL